MSSCRVTGLGVFCVPPIGVKPVQEPPRKAQNLHLAAAFTQFVLVLVIS